MTRLLLLLFLFTLQIKAKEHSFLNDRYSIHIPDHYVVRSSSLDKEMTLLVVRSGRNPLSGINMIIYHAEVTDKEEFEKNAQAYFASVEKGLQQFKKAEKIENKVLSYKASGIITYKEVEYTMDAWAKQYKNAVFYGLIYQGDEDKKQLNQVLSTFHQQAEDKNE